MKKMTIALLLCLGVCALTAADFALIRNGKAAADIMAVKDKKVSKDIRLFNEALKRCTKTVLPVVKKRNPKRNTILIKLVDAPVEKSDDYSITFPDKKTMLITGSTLSVNWALCQILEDHLNVRFLFQISRNLPYKEDINHYPATKNASVPMKTVRRKASYNLERLIDWRTRPWDWRWRIKNALPNSHMIPIDVLPVYKYAVDQSWPRNVMPTINGKKYLPRKAKAPLSKNPYRASRGYAAHWNPCFTHPDSTRIAIENILENLSKDPKRTTVCLSINDNGGMCQCGPCRKSVNKRRNSLGYADYSPAYWKWVNNIADAVTKKYPHIYVTALAYREVIDAPNFKLNRKVVPKLCFELTAMSDPEVRRRRIKLLDSWRKVAAHLTIWDYSFGVSAYIFPRIYFKNHSEKLELLHKYNVRGIFVESYTSIPFEGPKHYVMAKKLFDINTDVEKCVTDYCNAAVGKKAGVYLRKYYDFWEKYWESPELKRTPWAQRKFGTYMPLGELPTHTYGLKKGDMKYLRSLMDKVVSLAETGPEKRRARVLEQMFELSELAAKILFSEIMTPEGKLVNASQALELLKAVPESVRALEAFMKHPYVKYYGSRGKLAAAQVGAISSVLEFLKDSRVRKEAARLSADKKIPLLIRAQMKIALGAKFTNLIKNGSFEKASPLPKVYWREGGAKRSSTMSSHGKFSYKLPSLCTYAYVLKIQPGKTYMWMFDIYSRHTSLEGVFSYQLTPRFGKRPVDHIRHLNNKLPGGKWVTMSGICSSRLSRDKKSWTDNMELMFYLRKFEKDDEVFIDNVRFICLDDMK